MASTSRKKATPTRDRRSTVRGARSAAKTNGSRPRDVIAVIKADHAAVNQLFRRYASLGDRLFTSRRRIAERVIKELSIHAAVEEQILYPHVSAAVPNGEMLVKAALAEHQSLKETLAMLDECSPESEEFDELMARARDEVRRHVKEEEEASDGILGQLRKHASREELQQMATMAKRLAPTHPHPHAPSTPPGNVIIGAAAALIDKARDKMTGRGAR